MSLMAMLYAYLLQPVLMNQPCRKCDYNRVVKFQFNCCHTYIQNFMSAYEQRKYDSLLMSGVFKLSYFIEKPEGGCDRSVIKNCKFL